MKANLTIQQIANKIGAEWLLLQYLGPREINREWFHFWRDWTRAGVKP